MMVPERGLKDTKRNRRWLRLVNLLDKELGGGQEDNESLAWKILKTIEDTR
jgi:hypothetical protein